MGQLTKIALTFFIALTAGCAATVSQPTGSQAPVAVSAAAARHIVLQVEGTPTVEGSGDWQAFRGEWRAAMAQAASAAGMKFDFADTAAPRASGPATLVRVKVNDYRFLSAGARYGFGVMTGNAFVNADVAFIELPSKKTLGTRHLNTTSSAWQGIFAPMTTKQLEALSSEIVKEVRQGGGM